MGSLDPFNEIDDRAPQLEMVVVDGIEIRPGHRVRLRPLGRADIFDIALEGKAATVIAIDQDYEHRVHISVTVDDDPGSDLGASGKPGHRFFFGVDEIEPIVNVKSGGAK